jgi:AraC-like DNA-binding protein
MRAPGTVAVLLLRALLDAARRARVPTDRVLEAIGVAEKTALDIDGWISVDAMTQAWTLVPALSNDPDFGLHAGENVPAGVYGLLEFAVISSPTFHAALERVARFYRLLGAMSELTFALDGRDVRLMLRPVVAVDANRLRHYTEHFFAMLVTRGRALARDEIGPRLIRFVHDAPANVTEHARVFQTKVMFGQPRNEIVLDRTALDTPLRTSNAGLARVLEETSSALLASVDADLVQHLRAALPEAMRAGDAGIAIVAKKLGMSTRTLQRKLRERDTSFADVLDEVRREIAERYAASGDTSFAEVAFLLGFSQPSAFHRAFKRWTGTTAKSYRAARSRPVRAS